VPNGGYPNGERVGRLEERMNRVEEGIANFRAFHQDVREFITRADTRDEERKDALERRDNEVKEAVRRRESKLNMWFAILGLTVAILTGLVGYLTYRDSQRKLGETAKPVVSSTQDSGLPQGITQP
jgi:hypothetical protein